MKKGTRILAAVLALGIMLGAAGCNAVTETQGNDVGVTQHTSLPDDRYLSAVPEQDQHLFQSGVCTTALPDNSEITKISFLINNYSMVWTSVYGSVDLENGKATYGMGNNLLPIDEYQVYDLTDEDIKAYRDAFDGTLLHDKVEFDNGYWKIAVEYKDGTCYAYQFDRDGIMRNTAENIMISAYFDKMDLDDNTRLLFGIQGY